jgi:hypothetical protein
MMGKLPEVLELQPVISRTQPVHQQLYNRRFSPEIVAIIFQVVSFIHFRYISQIPL